MPLVSVHALTFGGKVLARPRRFTDEEILATTQSCILEHGPGVSTLMIAEKIGLSQAALFKRFGTKEQLIVRSLQQPMQPNPIARILSQGPTDAPIPDQLVEIGVTTMVNPAPRNSLSDHVACGWGGGQQPHSTRRPTRHSRASSSHRMVSQSL